MLQDAALGWEEQGQKAGAASETGLKEWVLFGNRRVGTGRASS